MLGQGDVIGDAHLVQGLAGSINPAAEVTEVFAVGAAPGNLCQREGTGEEHIVPLPGLVHILRPVVALDAYHVVRFAGGLELRGNGVVVVYFLKGGVVAYGRRLNLAVSLEGVEVHAFAAGSHYNIVPCGCGFLASGLAPPAHNRCLGRKASFKDLVPAYELAAVLCQDALHTMDCIALQLFYGSAAVVGHNALVLNALLAEGALFPSVFAAFVAADVDVLRGEELHYLFNYVFKELEGAFLARAQGDVGSAPGVEGLYLLSGAAEPGIRPDGGNCVPGHLYLRDNGDEALCGICHHFLYLFLSIVAAVYGTVELGAPGAYLLQSGILLDLYAPALVVRKVPVHHVHLIAAHYVYLLLDVLYAHEVAARIYVEASPGKAGGVLYLHEGDFAARLDELTQGLTGIEEAGLVGSHRLYAFVADGQGIALRGYA